MTRGSCHALVDLVVDDRHVVGEVLPEQKTWRPWGAAFAPGRLHSEARRRRHPGRISSSSPPLRAWLIGNPASPIACPSLPRRLLAGFFRGSRRPCGSRSASRSRCSLSRSACRSRSAFVNGVAQPFRCRHPQRLPPLWPERRRKPHPLTASANADSDAAYRPPPARVDLELVEDTGELAPPAARRAPACRPRTAAVAGPRRTRRRIPRRPRRHRPRRRPRNRRRLPTVAAAARTAAPAGTAAALAPPVNATTKNRTPLPEMHGWMHVPSVFPFAEAFSSRRVFSWAICLTNVESITAALHWSTSDIEIPWRATG